MSEIKDLLQSITSDNQTKAKEQFDAIIADKVSNALDARKVAVAQKRFNESVTEAKREFKNGDKVYIHDGDSFGPEVHFEGIVIGYVGNKVKIKGTGQDKGKTKTSEEQFVALQTDFDE